MGKRKGDKNPPASVQADVPNKLVQMAVWALALHPPRETHQTVDVLYVCSHLETLLMQLQQHYSCVGISIFFICRRFLLFLIVCAV